MKEFLALGKFAETKIEQAGAMTIHKNDAQAGEGAQQVCQRLQVKVPVDEKLRGAQLCGQIILAPEASRTAGEYRLGAPSAATQIM